MELRAGRCTRHAARWILWLTLLLAFPAAAEAAPELERPASDDVAPAGYELTARKAIRIAARSETIEAERSKHDEFRPTAYTRGPGRWQVSWFDEGREVAQARVGDSLGVVLEAWTGDQVAWSMARGYDGAFGRKINAPYVWLPLCLLFFAPFFDRRRPLRMLHLDLAALLAFGVSHVFFNRGEIDVSVPLVYPVLVYLLARLLWIGFRARSARGGRLVPHVPLSWLALAIVFLVAFRVGLNVVDSNVIDVGYAGVIGADRIADGDKLYGPGFADDVDRGDTYGPVTYLAYLPFEQAMPWSGAWDGLPAAHGAAIAFDLLTLLGLLLLGMRMRPGRRGIELGTALAYAWAAYPYAAFALETNSNDALIGLTTVGALLGTTLAPGRRGASAVARGAAVALGAGAKFAPLILAPLFATAGTEHRARERGLSAALFAAALALTLTASFAFFLPDGGLREIYDRTVGYQASRGSPFSVWGQADLSGTTLHSAAKAAALGLALLVAFVPRRRDAFQTAALAAAVLIAIQLTATHWFYLYVAWFAPLALVAVFAPTAWPRPADARAEAERRPGVEPAPA